MEIRYSYRVEDLEEITAAAYKTKYRRAERIRISYLGIGIASLALPFLAAGSLLHPDRSLWFAVVLGVLFIYYGLQSPRRLARKRNAKTVRNEEYTATISEDGVVTVSPTVRTELKWEAFSSIIHSKTVVALTCNAVMYMFPRRAFSDEQWEEFSSLIRKHVPQA